MQLERLNGANAKGNDGGGMQGDGQMPVDAFDMIYERCLKEIENLMESAKLVLGLPYSSKNLNQGKYSQI